MSEMMKERVSGLRDCCGAVASAVVSRDGLVIAADVPPGTFVETFAIMCATILGAAVTSNNELKRGNPDRITIEGPDSKTYIMAAGKKALVVAVTDGLTPDDRVFSELKTIASLVQE
jgi:predicted regulator of Ras-like GTPase activity (Roadblock/LC7/MglB family)